MSELPKFKIGDLEINLIQGGMGVGISRSGLASAVANSGGAGIIASVGLGLLKDYTGISYAEANQQALREEIRAAREMSNGVIGVNIMHALSDYKELVEVAVEENIDLIISGAGIPKDLPELVGDKPIALVPIVSSSRVADTITNAWRKYGKVPDAFIVEGPKAGGHLGFNHNHLVTNTAPRLEDITRNVINFTKNPDNFTKPVPVIVAGGIYTGGDIAHYLKRGAAGVQMATRFVTTRECDAADPFKQTYVDATEEEIQIIESPVGMPGRAIINPFLEKVERHEEIKVQCNFKCLKSCKRNESPYCIAKALVQAQKGNLEEGFVFAGSNAYRATPESCLDADRKFITVETLMQRLSDEYHAA